MWVDGGDGSLGVYLVASMLRCSSLPIALDHHIPQISGMAGSGKTQLMLQLLIQVRFGAEHDLA